MAIHSASRYLTLLALVAGASVVGGCSTVSVSSTHYLGVPAFPATDPAQVEILRREPGRAHERLGEVVLEPAGDPELAKIEGALRSEAAKLGANAVVVVRDGTRRVGAWTDGWRWVRTTRVIYGRVIVAVAIRYH
jgi:hypothetical protein